MALTVALMGVACASTPPAAPRADGAPRFPDYPRPDIPASLTVTAAVREQHAAAWQRLQAGDTRRATQAFTAILKQHPGFYPAEAGLGFAYLAVRQYKNAEPRFTAAVTANRRYLPAWIGRSEALLGLGRDDDAIDSLEQVLAIEPGREATRTRLDLLRLRRAQALIDGARRARAAGRLEEAERQLEQALTSSPQSTAILHELVLVELAALHFDEAEAHARRAVQIEPRVGEWHATLGDVLEAQRKYREASASYARAETIEPRPEWRARTLDLREKAEAALLPAEFSRLPSAATITRGETAAFIGIHLEPVITSAPRRVTDVATDIRTHWASTWILPVTRAGVMSIYPNHTFQPGATVRRSDLASIVAALVRLAASGKRADLARWQAARPRMADVPASHVWYSSASLAVAAGAMAVDADGRFHLTRPATGRDLDTAVRRIAEIAGR